MRLNFWNYTIHTTIMDDEMKNNSYDFSSVRSAHTASGIGTQLSDDDELLFNVLKRCDTNKLLMFMYYGVYPQVILDRPIVTLL